MNVILFGGTGMIGRDVLRECLRDVTLAAARPLAAANPRLTFTYVSGEGTDSTAPDAGVRTRILRPQDTNRLGQSPPDQR
ncbi:hypothetical protein [Streptomyces sp. NPDC051704]|uniref:hypothetical protein n=1 Tax=Streptomyces sp. NPDC051704 TaxID=3365671 RepID=UPI00378795D5